jgi:hypothetical protein
MSRCPSTRVVLGTGGEVLLDDRERCWTYDGLMLAAVRDHEIRQSQESSKTFPASKDKFGDERGFGRGRPTNKNALIAVDSLQFQRHCSTIYHLDVD